jgi:hypothetical protein
MTAVVKSTKAGYDAISASKCIVISELLTAGAGLAFEKLAPVYIDSDGKVRPATDDSTNELNFDGFAMSLNDSPQAACPVPSWAWGLLWSGSKTPTITPPEPAFMWAQPINLKPPAQPPSLWLSMAKKSSSLLLLAYVRQWHKEPIQ